MFRVALAFAILGSGIGVAPVDAQQAIVTEFGASMRYLAHQSDPGLGSSWQSPSFDASAWTPGTFGVGYENGTGAAALIQTSVPPGTLSVYARVLFDVDDPGLVHNLFLGADYDDGYAAWINGVEVYRSPELPPGSLNWDTPSAVRESSNHTSPVYDSRDISAAGIPALVAGENVLALAIYNASAESSDLVLVPQLIVSKALNLVRGPYLQLGSSTGVTVRWRTAEPQESRVDYGSAPGSLTESVVVPGAVTEHVVALTGLTPDTRYYYAIGQPGDLLTGDDEDHYFVTAPVTGTVKPTRIWVLGDSGTGTVDATSVRDAYSAFNDRHTDMWWMLGDNAYESGTDAEFQTTLFNIYGDTLRTTALWPTLGNHDAISADSSTQSGPYYDIFSLPDAAQAGGMPSGTEAYYSFDHANIHVVVLDSQETDRSETGDMLLWLEQDLAATAQDWVIAFWHHPPYSKGSHDSDSEMQMIEMRENALPLLEDHGVDLVLTGHSHNYERSFLLDGHYGDSTSFDDSMKVNPGDGREGGDGIYTKADDGMAPHQGTVYVVAGCAGSILGNLPLNHPAMYMSQSVLGSVVLDIDGDRLDFTFLSGGFQVLDHFTILKGCADQDQDGICADADNCLDVANPQQLDTDGDGLGDGCDMCPNDPGNDDPDGDQRCGAEDNCPEDPNPLQEDADDDGIGDACDACPLDPQNDSDQDGVCESDDNCPAVANSQQSDIDGDGLGDACDPCPADPDDDLDLDGHCGDSDTCPSIFNSIQSDTDGDGTGDACDPCPLDPADDADGDGFCADRDSCPAHANADQLDSDADGVGDACDPCPLDPDDDWDGDGLCADADNCPNLPSADQSDSDSDGIGDPCDVAGDSDGDGLFDPEDNCPFVSNPSQSDVDGDGLGDPCDPDDDDDGTLDAGDCAAGMHGVSSVPGPVGATLRLSQAGATQLRWRRAAQGHTSNVYRGFSAGAAALDRLTCFDAENPGTDSQDAETPPPGGLFYYVVAGYNACGVGDPGGSAAHTRQPLPTCAPVDADTDLDRIADLGDNCPQTANPNQADFDADHVGDRCDNCPTVHNPEQADADLDLQGDACDGQVDSDLDGTPDDSDNCPEDFNVDQGDADADGLGDVCDGCPEDADNDADADGVCGDQDNCPALANTQQVDSDGDGLGDACDACPADPDNDIDDDGLCADEDNCPLEYNPLQDDTDADDDGDACDPDDDNDGIADGDDNCPLSANPDQTDTDDDGAGDACDADDDNDGVPDVDDSAPLDPNVCRDADGDTCDDCSGGNDDPAGDGADFDADGLCDAGDPDDDNDGVADGDDGAPLDPNVCRDADGDSCDDCAGGTDNPADDGADFDGDGLCDAGDPDDDNDGVPDGDDGAPLDPNVCRDTDGDTCDDCSSGTDDTTADGADFDGDGLCDAGDPDDDNDGVADGDDGAPLDPNVCRDTDGDTCDDCASGTDNPADDGADFDGDGLCDAGDPDDDNDGVPDGDDSAPLDPDACRDADADTCDDCASGTDNPADDGADFDSDGLCDAGDPDDDNDGVPDGDDSAPLDPNVCRDADGDSCDDCASGTDNPAGDGADFDSDGLCDAGDPDDDNDGVPDADDSAPLDPNVCRDADGDSCDDCAGGADDPAGDGPDFDGDGICDAGDPDDDNDGVPDGDDSAPHDPDVCRDTDADTCDDCSGGTDDPAGDGPDFDSDGLCDAGDPDDDNDGVPDAADNAPLNPLVCRDADSDTCDDCTSGVDDPSNDGPDYDGDGRCNAGDTDDDNDGILDGPDRDPLNEFVCADIDFDTCDDCTGGHFSPANDGTDTDGDGTCDAGDPDDDNDGVPDASDSAPLNPTVCSDLDGDTCDDCTSGTYKPANDGTDTDGDGLCDLGDPDDDNDGVPDGSDAAPLDRFVCSDIDADSCEDCSSGTFAPASDGIDADADGLCDAGDPCINDPLNDVDGDGVCGDVDNCPAVSNPGQVDSDGDGIGDICDCSPAVADDFSVDASPPAGWTVVRGPWTAAGGTVGPDQSQSDAAMYFSEEVCSSDHWARTTFAVMGRKNGVVLRQVPGDFNAPRYAVVYDDNADRFRWLSCVAGCSEIASTSSGSVAMSAGDTLAALVTGTGSGTVLSVWKNAVGSDPLAWGTPDWISTADPDSDARADTGRGTGLYAERGTTSLAGRFDDFAAAAVSP